MDELRVVGNDYTAPPQPHPVISLLSACFAVTFWFLAWLRTCIAFVTITIPKCIYAILSYSLTLRLNFWTLVTIFFLLIVVTSYFVRTRYLGIYEDLRELPLGKPDVKELHPDVQGEDPPPAFHNYLDEFLSAVRIFGFLEKPVFHELARHLQTRRLIAGDSLALDQDKSFYCVVDGLVQVFAPTGRAREDGETDDAWADEDMNGYQLLNEVGSGGTLSSLFTILSLFTEDIKLRWPAQDELDDESADTGGTSSADDNSNQNSDSQRSRGHKNRLSKADSDISQLDLLGALGASGVPSTPGSTFSKSSRLPSFSSPQKSGASTPYATGVPRSPNQLFSPFSKLPLLSPAPSISPHFSRGTRNAHEKPSRPRPSKKDSTFRPNGAKRGLVARATMDTTLAVIPAEAFTRLTKKFPKASAHIVQVILTRFSRVTFNAAHRYLGLTSEVLRTEKAINDLACHPLPSSFYEGGGMQSLRARFAPSIDMEDDNLEDEDDQVTTESSTIGEMDSDDYFGPDPAWSNNDDSRSNWNRNPSRRSRNHSPTAKRQPSKPPALSTSTHQPWTSFAPAASSPLTRMSHPNSSRVHVTAGDLLSSTGPDTSYYHPSHATPYHGALNTPITFSSDRISSPSNSGYPLPTPLQKAARLPHPGFSLASPRQKSSLLMTPPIPNASAVGDIDLRDEVMACIAKSIGLIQPPLSTSASGDNSPILVGSLRDAASPNGSPFEARSRGGGPYMTPFTPLSFLETADDGTASSITGSSALGLTINGQSPYASGLDNEVEILCFAAGSSLVRAGERNAGLFYVIDGFLDVSMPADDVLSSNPASTAGQGLRKGLNSTAPTSTTSPTVRLRDKHEFSPSRARKNSASRGFGASGGRGTPGGNNSSTTERPHLSSAMRSSKQSRYLFTVKPGGIAGYLASLCGIPSYVDIKAKVDTYVGFLPSHALERLLEKRPIVLLTLSKRLISLLSPLVLHIDSSLDWMQVTAGQVLWRPGDASDSFFIVINGRLRAISDTDDDDGVKIVGEYGQGDTVGELDVITSSERRTTLHAIRDTELARMPRTLFNAISVRHPQATVQLLRMIASRVRTNPSPSITSNKIAGAALSGARNNLNLKTVAILPSSRSVPIAAFAKKLQNALEDIGAPTAYLNQASLSDHLGRHAFTRMGKLKVAGWLADQEQRYRIVLYVADSSVNAPWTQTCIRQADYVMVVGMGDDPSIGEYERLLLTTKTTARKELVLLHPDRSVVPGSTREWLKNRPWVQAHLHVELQGIVASHPAPILRDPAAVEAFKNLKHKVQTEIQKYRGVSSAPRTTMRPNHLSDFARLARRLCGKSIGVVLGGGGARGIAHLGLLRALEEKSVPVDQIGGTSIGSFVGGLYAREGNLISCSGRTKGFSARMGNIWRILSDLTWPVVAYTTGHEFNRSIFKAYGALHIEDMWLPYFCNTTNILTSRMEIHETGYAWRYVRASMTLVGLLPPLCDNGQMLVDGGYLDNLPVSTMMSMGASTVFAADVGSLDDNSPRSFGDTVSGWWLLINKWNPFSAVDKIPAITEIQSRLAYVSSVSTLEAAKATPGCLYIQLPVQEYGTLQFGKFEEIAEAGYRAALEILDQWKVEGKLPTGFVDEDFSADKTKKRKGRSLRRNSI